MNKTMLVDIDRTIRHLKAAEPAPWQGDEFVSLLKRLQSVRKELDKRAGTGRRFGGLNMAKRKKCFNCHWADVIRILGKPARFPLGVFCDLQKMPTPPADPRDMILSCDHVCGKWLPRCWKKELDKCDGAGRRREFPKPA